MSDQAKAPEMGDKLAASKWANEWRPYRGNLWDSPYREGARKGFLAGIQHERERAKSVLVALEGLTKESLALLAHAEKQGEQLAAAQAENARLREALEEIEKCSKPFLRFNPIPDRAPDTLAFINEVASVALAEKEEKK